MMLPTVSRMHHLHNHNLLGLIYSLERLPTHSDHYCLHCHPKFTGGTTDNYKETQTQTQTTLNSITDASLLLRVGGLLSVMTYPGSNLEESRAVEHFAEGLAMLTTRDVGGWRGYANDIPDYDDDGGRVRENVSRALERVVAEGSKKQTWRVFLHKPLGRPLSPVLVTAMRIK
mmetsp:Transcript_21723/g.32886  ORF Transcript_21723/g.32886 Transcript_21723/m.32886 type:complete len:173 (-) Transcript_21723:163-681(-)